MSPLEGAPQTTHETPLTTEQVKTRDGFLKQIASQRGFLEVLGKYGANDHATQILADIDGLNAYMTTNNATIESSKKTLTAQWWLATVTDSNKQLTKITASIRELEHQFSNALAVLDPADLEQTREMLSKRGQTEKEVTASIEAKVRELFAEAGVGGIINTLDIIDPSFKLTTNPDALRELVKAMMTQAQSMKDMINGQASRNRDYLDHNPMNEQFWDGQTERKIEFKFDSIELGSSANPQSVQTTEDANQSKIIDSADSSSPAVPRAA